MTDASSSGNITTAAGSGLSHRGPGAVSRVTTPPPRARQEEISPLRMMVDDSKAGGDLVASTSPYKGSIKVRSCGIESAA